MKSYTITVNGTPYQVVVEENTNGAAPVAAPVATPVAAPKAAPAPKAAAAPAAPAAAGATTVSAPMPGIILDVKVQPGAAVKAGQVLLILEAMKMENDIVAPVDGTVAGVSVKKGDTVNAGDALVSLN